MPVEFVIGRSGAGKSEWVRQRIVKTLDSDPLGPPVLLLVPRQATLEHERLYALASDLPGFARLHVVSFERLTDEILAECGGEALTQITGAGRRLLLGHLLRTRADSLGYLRSAARHAGMIRQLDATLMEFDAAGIDPAEVLTNLAESGEPADEELSTTLAKTRDLALLGDAYHKLLGDRLDPAKRASRVLGLISDCAWFAGAAVYVDAFDHLTAFERQFLAQLADAVEFMAVTVRMDPDSPVATRPELLPERGELFIEPVESYRRLHGAFVSAGVKVRPPVLLSESHLQPPALRVIERNWSQPGQSQWKRPDASAVRMIEAADPRAEADAAARQVKDWTLQGYRLRDCVILCRDTDIYRPLVESAFAQHGLRLFVDRRRPAQHHPLVRCIRSLLRIAEYDWPHESAMELCKCGLAGTDSEETHILENYVLEHRIRGRRAWTDDRPWTHRHAPGIEGDTDELPATDEDATVADGVRRRLVDAISPLTEVLRGLDRPLHEHAAALWRAIEALEIPTRLSTLATDADAAGDAEAADEHRQAWAAWCDLLDQAVDLLGNETVSGTQFVSTLDFGLDQLDFAVAPPTLDSAIFGDVTRTITVGCRGCIVLGLNDGIFPRAAETGLLLGDADRRALRERKVEIEAPAAEQQGRERYLGYVAFTRASEHLIIVRSAADLAGREATPSAFWERVRMLLGCEPEQLPREATDDLSLVASPQQIVATTMQWARDGAVIEHDAAGLYAYLATRPSPPVAAELGRAWPALSYENTPALTEETIAALFGDALYTSVSRLETFAACPFKHFAQHALALRGRDEDRVTPRDLGVVYHDVLEHLIRDVLGERLDLFKDVDAVSRRLPELAAEVGERLRGGILTQDARGRYLLERAGRSLDSVIAGQRAALQLGAFRPRFAELIFGTGEGAHLPPLEWKTPTGRTVRIHGRIDRIDTTPDGRVATVIDYKTTTRNVSLSIPNVYHGLSLQLLVYLLVLQEHSARLSDPAPQPVAAFYVKLLRGIEHSKEPEKAPSPDNPEFDLRIPPRGLIDYDHLPLLDTGFANSSSGAERHAPHHSKAYHAKTKKDGDPYAKGTDIVEVDHFDALLIYVRQKIEMIAEEILSGDIRPYPFRIGTRSPCSMCEFRGVCRFDPPTDPYRFLEAPEDLWSAITKGVAS